jgi:hypothetical protein
VGQAHACEWVHTALEIRKQSISPISKYAGDSQGKRLAALTLLLAIERFPQS